MDQTRAMVERPTLERFITELGGITQIAAEVARITGNHADRLFGPRAEAPGGPVPPPRQPQYLIDRLNALLEDLSDQLHTARGNLGRIEEGLGERPIEGLREGLSGGGLTGLGQRMPDSVRR